MSRMLVCDLRVCTHRAMDNWLADYGLPGARRQTNTSRRAARPPSGRDARDPRIATDRGGGAGGEQT